MQEYKREKSSLETRLKELTKATEYHNDHLRIIDAWFKQVGFLSNEILCPVTSDQLSVLTSSFVSS